MKTLYIDCSMGAAGDMLSAALFELLPKEEQKAFLEKLNSRGIPGVQYVAEPSVKCGITGTHMSVLVNGEEEGCGCDHEHSHEHEHEHHHHHSSMHDIEHIVGDHMKLPTSVALDVLAVYQEIAEAESHVHGQPVDQIHFHEVGSMDAVADITAVCLLMKKLAPDEVIVSPIHVGSGTVKCAHGILPVPAPATAYILRGIPTYSADISGELCTPTGAALLKHFATGFGKQPMMKTSAIGYGMGKKDFPRANCVRVMLGETVEEESVGSMAPTDAAFAPAAAAESAFVPVTSGSSFASNGDIIELSCNVDDMTGEDLAYATDRIFAAGALDVSLVPVFMKKGRPGQLAVVICRDAEKDAVVAAIFKHTSTLGIREKICRRHVLARTDERLALADGTVCRRKVATGFGVRHAKWEADDLAAFAARHDLSLDETRVEIEAEAKPWNESHV